MSSGPHGPIFDSKFACFSLEKFENLGYVKGQNIYVYLTCERFSFSISW